MPNNFGFVRPVLLLFIIAIVGIVSFLLISSAAPFEGNFDKLYPKPKSHAAVAKDFGVNLAGGEFGTPGARGTLNTDYLYFADTAVYNYFSQKGLKLMRIPFTWERVQAQAMGPLSTPDINGLKSMLDAASASNTKVILDLHNFARYYNTPMTTADAPKLADVWTKLATQYKNHPALYGYELMNEPHDLPEGAASWGAIAQSATNAIRQVDSTHYVIVPGYSWQNARFWVENNPTFPLNDPANKTLYAAHLYFDSDYSGSYVKTYDADGAYTNIGVDRVQPFLDWLQQKNVTGIMTEYGLPGSDTRWLSVLDNFENHIYQNDRIVGGAYWAAGPWWGNYPLSLHPIGQYPNFSDQPQMAITQKYPSTSGSIPTISPTPQVSSSPLPNGSLIIYDDALSNLFANYSYGGTTDFSSTLSPYSGTRTIQMQVNATSFGINLHANNPINISSMKTLTFAARVSSPGSSYEIVLYDGLTQTSVPLANIGGDLTTIWRLYTVPISQFNGINFNSWQGLNLKELSNSTGKTVFLDNVSFGGTLVSGDIDGDGHVTISDYNILISNYGKTGNGLQGDFDNNGVVNIFDYNVIVTNFGK